MAMKWSARSVVALIPARSGSKRLPQKNISELAGFPLIYWTIKAANDSSSIDTVLVSTDSPQIAAIAQKFGAEVPFLRPPELASDDSSGIDVVLHLVDWVLSNKLEMPEFILYLQPTSPLRTSQDIEDAIQLARERNADTVVSVSPVFPKRELLYQLNEDDGTITSVSLQEARRLRLFFKLNGAIYLARSRVLVETRSWYTKNTHGYIMPLERSLDIDTIDDLRLAESLINHARNTDSNR